MQIHAVTQSPIKDELVFIFSGDNCSLKSISSILSQGVFKPKIGKVYFMVNECKNYLAVGLGDKNKLNVGLLKKAISTAYEQLKLLEINSFCIDIRNIGSKYTRIFIETLVNEVYIFDQLKSEKSVFRLKEIHIITQITPELDYEIKVARAIASGKNYAKDLKNLPANICTTSYLLNEAKNLANCHKNCVFNYIDDKIMENLGMGCITAVGRGSSMPNYIACIEYYGGKQEERPIILVGKGLVYDTGGLCLKPWKSMGSMKMDMGGAAAVLGTMKAVIELNLPINIIGVTALVENSIDSNSYRPGDVLTSMQGTTVEVGNTDAEGRLVLCDTLTYIDRYNPKIVIDIATLTGAIIVSLGEDITGLFGNSSTLISDIEFAAEESHDHVWHMPLHTSYYNQLDSNIADLCNVGGTGAGSITAALFLSKFAEKYTWAHLDIAGVAMKGCFEKAFATGRPVPMLTQYLINQVNSK